MSNLNINNVDVQRIISVLNELNWKMEVCSCLTMSTMDKILSSEKQIEENFPNHKTLMKVLKNHYNIMMSFRQDHLIFKDDRKEEKLDDDSNEEEEGLKEVIKERQDLKHLEDNLYETHPLVKSTKNVYRELKGNWKFIDFIKSLRQDKEITEFSDNFTLLLLSYIKKSKMTLEEEYSEKDLNATLTKKIEDMKDQIREKQNKLDKLKEDKKNFKNECTENLEGIKNKIENLKLSTENSMKKKEYDINQRLEIENKNHQETLDRLSKNYKAKEEEFKTMKKDKADEEKQLIGELEAEEGKLSSNIQNYDTTNRDYKRTNADYTKEIANLNENIKKSTIELAKNKEQFELYDKAQKDYEEKVAKDDKDRLMEEFACNWIQNQFRGFLTRKQLKRKYGKIVAGLKKIPPDMSIEKDPKKAKKKK